LNKEELDRQKHLERIAGRLFEKSEPNSSEWLGSIVRYFWHLGKKKFKSLHSPKQIKTNRKVGRWFVFFVIILFISIFYLWITNNN
jgi:hypothetical protein